MKDSNGIVFSPTIRRENDDITDRCLRKWIELSKFPEPDGNLNGRNFWFRSTYEAWKADVLAGKYSQRRRPGVSTPADPQAA